MSTEKKERLIEIPFNQIANGDDENSRSKLTKIPELAENIREVGLLEPLGIVNGQEGDKPYKVKYGNRRWHALQHLKWGTKLVPCIIVEEKGSGLAHLAENLQREDLPSVDLAQRLHDLELGQAPGSVGEKFTKKELAAKLGMSLSHVSNLIRAHKNLGKAAKDVWRKFDVPTTTIFSWAGLSEEEQEGAVAKWKKEQDRIKERAAAKGGDGEGEEKPAKRGKKDEEAEEDRALVKGKKASLLETNQEILQWKLDQGHLKSKEEIAEAKGQIQLIRFMLGDIARFPSVSTADQREYGKWLANQEADEAEDEEGEE